jgi:hypothetical protein
MGGASSKQVFQGIIGQLLTQDIAANDHDFWDDMWKVSDYNRFIAWDGR